MDDTWGLSWSRRWHKIDEPRSAELHRYGSTAMTQAVSCCGAYVYRQERLRQFSGPRHLKIILAEPEKAAGVCKKCEKKTR